MTKKKKFIILIITAVVIWILAWIYFFIDLEYVSTSEKEIEYQSEKEIEYQECLKEEKMAAEMSEKWDDRMTPYCIPPDEADEIY